MIDDGPQRVLDDYPRRRLDYMRRSRRALGSEPEGASSGERRRASGPLVDCALCPVSGHYIR